MQASMGLGRLQLALWQFLMDITVQKLVRWPQSCYWSISRCILFFFSIPRFLFCPRYQRECYLIRENMIMLLNGLVGMRNSVIMCCILEGLSLIHKDIHTRSPFIAHIIHQHLHALLSWG